MKYRSNLLWPGAFLLSLLIAGCSGTALVDTSSDAGQNATSVQAIDAGTSGAADTEIPQATATPAGEVITAENATRIEQITHWSGHNCDFYLAFSPDSQNLVSTSCDQDSKVRVWNLASNTEQIWDHKGAGFGATYSPDGSVLAVWSLGPKVILYDVATGTVSRTLEHTDYIFDVDISPDGTVIAGAGGDGTVVVWDLATGETPPSLQTNMGEHDGELWFVTGVAFSPDGTALVDAGEDGTARIWDLATGSMLGPIRVQDKVLAQSIKFLPDGSGFVVNSRRSKANFDGAESIVTVFDATGNKLRTIGGVGSGPTFVRGFDISPDGNLLATVLGDGTIVLYDIASGSEVHRFAGGAEYVDVVVFSPDGRLIASEPRYADENRIEVWGINP